MMSGDGETGDTIEVRYGKAAFAMLSFESSFDNETNSALLRLR